VEEWAQGGRRETMRTGTAHRALRRQRLGPLCITLYYGYRAPAPPLGLGLGAGNSLMGHGSWNGLMEQNGLQLAVRQPVTTDE
jgi:hypothetical protein